jgi:hypothetical protein
MPKLPEKLEEENRISREEAEIALIGAGYCRLSEADRRVILGEAEALRFAQEAAQKAAQERVRQGRGEKS